MKFESSVNSEGIETSLLVGKFIQWFESSVNSEGIETNHHFDAKQNLFESSVNSEGIETMPNIGHEAKGLRAV